MYATGQSMKIIVLFSFRIIHEYEIENKFETMLFDDRYDV